MSKNHTKKLESDVFTEELEIDSNTTEETAEPEVTETVSEELVQATEPAVEETTSDTPVVNPFDFSAMPVENKSESRRLDYTPALIDFANRRAQELMLNQVKLRPDLTSSVQKVLKDLNPNDLADLLTDYFGETIDSDAEVLDGCDDNQLGRLLESRRSDRSKAKTKYSKQPNMSNCKSYLSAMYAELMIRVQTGKPYSGSTNGQSVDVDESDLEAISRRVKSLQSKKCRLKPLAEYDDSAREDLEEVEAEINRLNSLRPNTRATTKVVVKDLSVDQIRAALKSISVEDLTEGEAEKYFELLQKLG